MSTTPPFTSRFIQGAAVILLRYRPELEVLLIQRSPELSAFPGHWAFPGGKKDAQDHNLEETALRELFEETGLVLATLSSDIALSQQREWQQQLNTNPALWQTLKSHLLTTSARKKLSPIGWRVAPPLHPVRFEAAYYYAEYTAEVTPRISSEAVQAVWWKPQDLLHEWQTGQALVPVPVLEVLRVLATVSHRHDDNTHEALARLANSRSIHYSKIELYPGVEILPLRTPTLAPATHTNTYLVGNKRFVVIDPATPYPEEQQHLKRRITERMAQGDSPEAILLTHHHLDHVGGAAFLQAEFGVPVFAHPLTQQRLQSMDYPLHIDALIQPGHVWDLSAPGQTFRLEALFTPGHAPGHVCFIEPHHKLGFVGDMVAGVGSIVIQHPEGSQDPDGHMQRYLDSLQRLKALALRRAFPAHGPMLTQPNQVFEDYIAHRLHREAQILKHLAQQPLSLRQLRHKVYPDLAPALEQFAEDSLRAHLVKLADEERIAHTPHEHGEEVISLLTYSPP